MDQYEKRVANLRQQVVRRRNWRVALVSVAILLITGIVGAAIYIPIRQSQINTHAERLAKLVDQARYKEADEYLAKLAVESPSTLRSDRLRDLTLRLAGLKNAEAERQAAFRVGDARIGTLTERCSKGGVRKEMDTTRRESNYHLHW